MERLVDWEARLSAFVTSVIDDPLVWGQHDCILWSCAAVEAQTGVDVAAEYRGTYSDAIGAAKALRKLGKGTLVKTIDAVFPVKPVGKAQRGDIVFYEGSAGICWGATGLFVGQEHLADKAGVLMREGLIQIPRSDWSRAWAV